MKHNIKKQNLICSFCSLSELDVDFLVEGEDVYICDKCVVKASEIDKQNFKKSTFNKNLSDKKPRSIKDSLDKHIISQNIRRDVVEMIFIYRVTDIYTDRVLNDINNIFVWLYKKILKHE